MDGSTLVLAPISEGERVLSLQMALKCADLVSNRAYVCVCVGGGGAGWGGGEGVVVAWAEWLKSLVAAARRAVRAARAVRPRRAT